MRINRPEYQAGRPWGCCDRCDFQYRLDELRKEWTGFKVCPACFDPKPDDLYPPRLYPEGRPVIDPRPDIVMPYHEQPFFGASDDGFGNANPVFGEG